jgi:uncharacterized protein YlxP (DUF503 family)
MKEEKLRELMEDNFKKFGWNTWKKKSSIIFALKAKYGSTFDVSIAESIYDDIYKRELKKLEEEYDR